MRLTLPCRWPAASLNALNTRLDCGAIAFMLEHGGAKILLVDPEFSAVMATRWRA